MIACRDCRYWSRTEQEADMERGECRRLPPVPVKMDVEIESRFPVTEPEDWCGEYTEDQLVHCAAPGG